MTSKQAVCSEKRLSVPFSRASRQNKSILGSVQAFLIGMSLRSALLDRAVTVEPAAMAKLLLIVIVACDRLNQGEYLQHKGTSR